MYSKYIGYLNALYCHVDIVNPFLEILEKANWWNADHWAPQEKGKFACKSNKDNFKLMRMFYIKTVVC